MEQQERKITDFGYELLRGTLLPELLGNEEPDILYWGGKVLARKNPLESIEEVQTFFQEAGWGELTVTKEKKRELSFRLTYLSQKTIFDRHLEAGFLAQQMEIQAGKPAETFIIKKHSCFVFEVQWDK